MAVERTTSTELSPVCETDSRQGWVRIVRVDYEKNELYDETGHGYYELPGGLWTEFGPVHEGSIRYWGSGSHAGHINLLPALIFSDGQWVSLIDKSI